MIEVQFSNIENMIINIPRDRIKYNQESLQNCTLSGHSDLFYSSGSFPPKKILLRGQSLNYNTSGTTLSERVN